MIRKFSQLVFPAVITLLVLSAPAFVGVSAPYGAAVSGLDDAGRFVTDSVGVSVIDPVVQNVNATADGLFALAFNSRHGGAISISNPFTSVVANFSDAGYGIADTILTGPQSVSSFYAYLNRVLPGRDFPATVAVAFSGFSQSAVTVHASTASIADSISSAFTAAADAVRLFFAGLWSAPPGSTIALPTPSSGAGSAVPRIVTTPITQAQLISALELLFRQGLPADIAAQLKGPKGDSGSLGLLSIQGARGPEGPAGPSGSAAISPDSLDFTDFSDAMTLDADTTVSNGGFALTFENASISQNFDVAGNLSVDGTITGDVALARIGNSTFSTVQHLQDVYHSTGWVSGGAIVDDGGGNMSVEAGTGLIRGSNNSLSTLSFFDWPASGSFALTDNATNYIYIEYNGGDPKVSLRTTEDTTDYHTHFLLAQIVRVGTTLYINEVVKPTVGDHAALMIREMQQVMPYTNASGAEIMAATNPLAFDIAAAAWWQGLNRFTTAAFDGDGDTFSYFYRDGGGGWNEVPGSTQIDNANYDGGLGFLSPLVANAYGVHWLYMDTDGGVSVVYGSGSYTLNEAQNAPELTDVPLQIQGASFIVGKIIVHQGGTALSQIDSVAMMQFRFPKGAISDHNSLLNLQGGTTDEYFHLTQAEHDRWASGSASLALLPDCSNGTASKLLYNPTTGVFTCGVDQAGGGGGDGMELREFRAGGFDSTPATVSFSANGFNLTASGAADVTVSLDYTNGPASRSIAQTITGGWRFIASGQFADTLEIGTASVSAATLKTLTVGGQTNLALASASATLESLLLKTATLGSDTTLTIAPASAHTFITGTASVSTNFEASGYASVSQLFGSNLSACTGKLLWSAGIFSCGTDQVGMLVNGLGVSEGAGAFSHITSLSFSASGFTVANTSSRSSIGIDYGNGPASRSIAQSITGTWTFSNGTYSVLFTGGNVGIGTATPTSRLAIVGTTSDLTANALDITNATGSAIFTVRNDGAVGIGTADPLNSALRVSPIKLYGAANLSTSGSSTTVTTTGSAFADVYPFTLITANGVSRTVVTKTDNNTVVIDSAVDWSAGYSFTYKRSANFTVDAPNDDVSRVLTFARGTTTDWTLLVRHDETGQNFYIRNGPTGKDTLTITEKGTMALNLPAALASSTPDIPATYSVYTQPFDKGFFFDDSAATYFDITSAIADSEDTPGSFAVQTNVDYLYLGELRKFSNAFFERVTGPTLGVLKAEYWNGASWVTMGAGMEFGDNTNGLTQTGNVTWSQNGLTGWAKTAVNGSASLYYVRLSFTTYVGDPLSVNFIVPNGTNRFDIFKAPSDANPTFSVNGIGHVALGDRVRDTRVDDNSAQEPAALSVIDTTGTLRLWNFSANDAAEIQLVAGIGSVTDNLQWSMELASSSGPYGTEGFSIHQYDGNVENPFFTLNKTNFDGTSAVAATFNNTFGNMDGNDLMRGVLLDFTNGTHTGTGNEVRDLQIGGITPSANASESAIVVGPGWDYAFIASQGNVGIGTETPNFRLEVGGAASVSTLFGAGLTGCTNAVDKLQYNATTGVFSCTTEKNAKIEEGGTTKAATQTGLDFSASGFNVTSSVSGGITEAVIALDYILGPASRSIAQTITGHWNFSAGATVSSGLEVNGALTASTSFFGANLSTCDPTTGKLTWSGGLFGCGVDQNTGGGGGATGTVQFREFGQSYVSFPATVSFDAGKFNLTASGASDVTVSLDWGAGGPASLSQNETVTGNWTFTTLAISHLDLTSASVSGGFEASGYASTSAFFGAGLTDCVGTFSVLRWTASSGKFSCGTEGGGLRTESSETTIVANNNALNFDSNRFSLTASGTTETNVALNLSGQFTFTGGVSVSTNPFEVGSHVFYADPTAARVGINTQNLTEALEVTGNASVSGNIYGANVGIGTTAPAAGYRLDAIGAARLGTGSHVAQSILEFNVGHAYTVSYFPTQFGQATLDGTQIRNGNTAESNIFSVYASQGAQFIANAQGDGFDSGFTAMNNPNVANLTAATQGLFTNKATTHDIALQYRFGTGTPIDAILLDVNPAANTLNAVIVNNGNQNVPFRVAGQNDANLLYTDGSSKVGIGTTTPLTKLEVQGTASASHLLTTGGLQVAGGVSVSYSRFGTVATTHGLSATNDVLVNGKFEVDGLAFFDSGASVSTSFEVNGTASISSSLFANGALTVAGKATFNGGVSVSTNFEVTGANRVGINAGGATDTTLEVGGTASISGHLDLGDSASSSGNFEIGGYASASKTFGSGLSDCDGTTSKLAWDVTTGKFSCATDHGATDLLGETQIQVASATFSVALSSAKEYVQCSLQGPAPSAAGFIQMRFNLDAGVAAYGWTSAQQIGGANLSDSQDASDDAIELTGAQTPSTAFTFEIYFSNTATKSVAWQGSVSTAVLTIPDWYSGAGSYFNTAQVTTVQFSRSAGNFKAGTLAFCQGKDVADYAENYFTTDVTVQAADVVTSDPLLPAGIRKAARAYDPQLIGVISTKPAITLDDGIGISKGRPLPVALSGRVPVKVSTINGLIRAGDMLTSSTIAGVAMKATKAGAVIGQAMESYDGTDIGKVMVFVQNGNYNGSDSQQLSGMTGDAVLSMMLNAAPASSSLVSTDRLVAGLDIIAPSITTRELTVETLRFGSDSISFQELAQGRDRLVALQEQSVASASTQTAELEQFVLNAIAPLTAADLQLAQSVASQSGRIDLLASRLDNTELNLAALASQSQALIFNGSVMFNGGLRVDSIGAIGDLLTFGTDTYFFGRPYFNGDTGGFAVIHAGVREVYVPFTAPYLEAPVVNASLLTNASQSVDELLTDNVRFAIASISGDGFTIRLAKNATADTRLSWIALAVHNARTVFSLLAPEPTPSATPEPPTASPTPDVSATPTASVAETPTLSETSAESPVPSESPVVTPSETAMPTESPSPVPETPTPPLE